LRKCGIADVRDLVVALVGGAVDSVVFGLAAVLCRRIFCAASDHNFEVFTRGQFERTVSRRSAQQQSTAVVSMLRKSSRKSSSLSSQRNIAPPDDGIIMEEGAGPDLQAEARRHRAGMALALDVQKRVAVENKAARRRSRRRASVEAFGGRGGAVAGGSAPPSILEVDEAGPDVKAEARRRRKSSSFDARERLRRASTVSILATVGTRCRATVDALEGGGAVAGGAESIESSADGAAPPADERDSHRLSNLEITAEAQPKEDAARAFLFDRRQEEAEAEAAARVEAEAKVEAMLVELRKIGSIAAVASQRARLWAGRHQGPQPQL
jgi:hypothetical protein